MAARVTIRTDVDKEAGMLTRRSFLVRSAIGTGAVAASWPRRSAAQETRTFTFAYDQPRDTAYSFMADTFEKKLGELSGGKLKIRQFPGAALGSEPEMAQKAREYQKQIEAAPAPAGPPGAEPKRRHGEAEGT